MSDTAVCQGGGKVRLEISRRDLFKLGGLVIAMLGAVTAVVVPLTGYIFQTRHQALEDHNAITTEAKLAKQELRLRKEADDKRDTDVDNSLKDTKAMLRVLDINQRTMMRDNDIPRREIKALPAGIDFADIDVKNP